MGVPFEIFVDVDTKVLYRGEASDQDYPATRESESEVGDGGAHGCHTGATGLEAYVLHFSGVNLEATACEPIGNIFKCFGCPGGGRNVGSTCGEDGSIVYIEG